MIWEQILEQLQLLANPEAVAGMARFGITPTQTYGVSLPQLRGLAKLVGQDHALALRLWETDIRETRILASMVADSRQVSEELMEQWVKDFDYWEICDQCCMNLFYSEADAWLDQYIVIEESGDVAVYRNWFLDYSLETICPVLTSAGFTVQGVWSDLVGTPYQDGSDWVGIVARKA